MDQVFLLHGLTIFQKVGCSSIKEIFRALLFIEDLTLPWICIVINLLLISMFGRLILQFCSPLPSSLSFFLSRFLQRRTKQKQVNYTSKFEYDYGKTNAESPTHITISNVGPSPTKPNTQALIDISSSHSVLNLPSTGTNYLFPLFPPSLSFIYICYIHHCV